MVLIVEFPEQKDTDTGNGFSTVNVTTRNGEFPYLKENQLSNISMTDSNGILIKNMEPADIRCRGNSTFSYAKKAYKITFDQNTTFIEGSSVQAKEWVLLANYKDPSMLRNEFAYNIGNVLDHIDFVSDSQFVNLYINDTYMGVYQLCDQMEVAFGRVEIDDALPAKDAGFLITLDTLATGVPYLDYFEGTTYKYSYRSSIYNEEQGLRIATIVNHAEETILNGTKEEIAAVIDLNSCIDMYLLQEFVKNYDVGWGSFYLYAHRGEELLYFGPPWDFDISCGNDLRLDNGSYEGLFVGNDTFEEYHTHLWYYQLMSYPWFQEMVKDRWQEVKSDIYNEITNLAEFSIENQAYFLKDEEKYMYTDMDPEIWLVDFDYINASDQLISWLYQRYDWLDDYFSQ